MREARLGERERERERGSDISAIKGENRERKNFWKIGEERDIARVRKTRRQERFRGRRRKIRSREKDRDGIDRRRKIKREK